MADPRLDADERSWPDAKACCEMLEKLGFYRKDVSAEEFAKNVDSELDGRNGNP